MQFQNLDIKELLQEKEMREEILTLNAKAVMTGSLHDRSFMEWETKKFKEELIELNKRIETWAN